MFRTKTTIIVGASAGCEIEFSDAREMLAKVASGFDFARLGSDLQNRDMVALARQFELLATLLDTPREGFYEAAAAIRTASRVSTSLDAILQQHAHDPLVQLVGKVALVYYTLQAEGRSPLTAEPRDPGDLPMRGADNWLFQLGQMIVSGVPRSMAEDCLDNLAIINFGYDRSFQHYLPWVFQMAFGMPLDEARELVGANLNMIYPLGCAGRLPWQTGSAPEADWGVDDPRNMAELAGRLRTASDVLGREKLSQRILDTVSNAERLVFLSFGFEALYTDLLFDGALPGSPEVLATVTGLTEIQQTALLRALKHRSGLTDDGLITIRDVRAFQLLRDYSLFLES